MKDLLYLTLFCYFICIHSALAQMSSASIQNQINQASPYDIITIDPNQEVVITSSITIDKPLTFSGLRAKLPDSLGIIIVAVRSEGVTLRNLHLTGNAGTVSTQDRKPLISVSKGDFIIENCKLYNSSKDGIEVSNLDADPIVGGEIRNIVGRGNMRDLISINGENDGHINHLLVENIRAYDSELRGAVEVSDGTLHTTVRKVYAENCIYAIDVQDHGYEGAINNTVNIQDVYAVNCRHAIRTANSPVGHSRHIFRDITAINCEAALRISNIDGVTLENVKISGSTGDGPAINITNCDQVSINNIHLDNIDQKQDGMTLINSDRVLIGNFAVWNSSLRHGIVYQITNGKSYHSLVITNSIIEDTAEEGIVLKSENSGSLKHILLQNNIATILNGFEMR